MTINERLQKYNPRTREEVVDCLNRAVTLSKRKQILISEACQHDINPLVLSVMYLAEIMVEMVRLMPEWALDDEGCDDAERFLAEMILQHWKEWKEETWVWPENM